MTTIDQLLNYFAIDEQNIINSMGQIYDNYEGAKELNNNTKMGEYYDNYEETKELKKTLKNIMEICRKNTTEKIKQNANNMQIITDFKQITTKQYVRKVKELHNITSTKINLQHIYAKNIDLMIKVNTDINKNKNNEEYTSILSFSNILDRLITTK